MSNNQLYLLALMLALFVTVVFVEANPQPEGATGNTEPEPSSSQPGLVTEAEGNTEAEGSSSMVHGHFLTAFVSFFAYVLLK